MYEHLNQIQQDNNWKKNPDSRKLKKSFNPDLEIVTRDVLSYLSKSVTNNQSVDTITNCMRGLAQFELEKIEKLQIINSTPYSLVNLYSIVEECDQRFSEEQCQEILDLISVNFPPPETLEGDDIEDIDDDEEEQQHELQLQQQHEELIDVKDEEMEQ